MDLEPVIIPTFISPYLFWIIKRRDLIKRLTLTKYLKKLRPQEITTFDSYETNPFCHGMVFVQVDMVWARAIVEQILDVDEDNPQSNPTFLCWLCDFAVMRATNSIYFLPKPLQDIPVLAHQASFFKVANLSSEFSVGDNGYELIHRKTVENVGGVIKTVLDKIQKAKDIYFLINERDDFNLYGDIICVNEANVKDSLVKCLIMQKLLCWDDELFYKIERSRSAFKKKHYTNSHSWFQAMDKSETDFIPEVVYNSKINEYKEMEFFTRVRN